uniref:Putative secreted protein n=1 Tax=Anopheles triannulatus TaxID=58253 RepID=A0A2M4B4M4_9DIPT
MMMAVRFRFFTLVGAFGTLGQTPHTVVTYHVPPRGTALSPISQQHLFQLSVLSMYAHSSLFSSFSLSTSTPWKFDSIGSARML